MFGNYLKIAFRNLLKNKVYSSINILGLSIGIATSLMIFAFVINEIQYDEFHPDSDRLYRVVQTMSSEQRTEEQASTPFPLATVLKDEFPDMIANSVRLFNMQEASHSFIDRENGISYREQNFFFADSTFFSVFKHPIISGDPSSALNNSFSLVITESLSNKYFGDEDPIGKQLNFKGQGDMTVTAVMEDWPEQSHLQIDILASFSSLDQIYRSSPDYNTSWMWNPLWTYIRLTPNANPDRLETQIRTLEDKYYKAYSGWPSGEGIEVDIQPITDIHLYSNRDLEIGQNGSIKYVYIFIAIALFVLIIACINFMNLSTARSMERSKEVGVRKVLGGYKKQLFFQFMGESFCVVSIATMLAILITYASFPFFNGISGLDLSFNLLINTYTLPVFLIFILIVSLLAGCYPAILLSSFNPVKVLKGTPTGGKQNALLRKALVTFQFSLSIILIVGTALVFRQIEFLQEKDLGFESSSIMILPTKQNLIAWEFDTFKDQALSHSMVESVTGLGKIPGSDKQEYYRISPAGNNQNSEEMNLMLAVTHDFIKTFNINVIAGRAFSKEYAADADNSVLINKSMATKLGHQDPQDAIGELFYYYHTNDDRDQFQVVGVVDDFNYSSVKKEIEPVVIRLVQDLRPILGAIEHTAIKVSGNSLAPIIEHLETTWRDINPIDPFEYQMLDEHLSEIYAAETIMGRIAALFTILCIFVACLGLLGLSSYSAQLKRREIGIRKSLGASVTNIIQLLSKQYLILIIAANIIAWPFIYILTGSWLQAFPYRISLSNNLIELLPLTLVLMIVLTLISVSYYSLKAALLNPVDAIRSE